MTYYAVIDTNVLVSAMLKWNSIPGNIIELSFNGTITPLFNTEIIREYREVLSRPKFHLTSDIINAVIDEIQNTGIYIDATKLDIILPNSKDLIFYEVVMEKRKLDDAYLVTGNIKHFPVKPYVVTPRQMLDIIISKL